LQLNIRLRLGSDLRSPDGATYFGLERTDGRPVATAARGRLRLFITVRS
jgi:hypothetical protein